MKRASIAQVAKRAGVSTMTVSRALRGSDSLAPETYAKVQEAVRALNYVPVSIATQNRHSLTRVVGLIFIRSVAAYLGSHTFLGLRAAASHHDYDLLVIERQLSSLLDAPEAKFLDRRADGYIFIGQTEACLLEKLAEHSVTGVVCYETQVPESFATISTDNRCAMRTAIACLQANGHQKIAHFAGPGEHNQGRARRLEFEQAIAETGCEPLVVGSSQWGWANDLETHQAANTLLDEIERQGFTSVVCANDFLAMTLWRNAQQRGWKLPEQLSLIGMDNDPVAQQNGLSSLAQPFFEIGQAAFEAFIQLSKGQNAQECSRLLPPQLIERQSVVPPG